MKKPLIYLYLTILAFALVFLSCEKNPTVPEENPSELIKVGFNIQRYNMSVSDLKSTEDDPFSVVEHEELQYKAGNFKLVNRDGELITVSFEQDGLDTTHIILTEGDWKIFENRGWLVNSDNNDHYYARSNIYLYYFGSSVYYKPDEIVLNEGYQTINKSSTTLNLFAFPASDCIAIYDTLDLLESVTSVGDYLSKDGMINYSNGVSVFYSENQWGNHFFKLRSGKIITVDIGELRDSLFDWSNDNIYLGTIEDHHTIKKPLFIKIELLPEEENPLMGASVGLSVIGFNDTISIKF